jgi:phosphatidylglycerophosphate synthase
MSIARPKHRELLHSALTGILLAAAAAVVTALLWTSLLGLSAFFIVKILAVLLSGAALLLLGLPRHHPFHSIGAANRATITRGALIALLAGLIGERVDGSVPAVATAAAVIAALLDAVDGWLARRTHMASGFGARFDMESDALLIFVLAVLAWQFGKAGIWVLLCGLLRYLFLAAGEALPRLRQPLPPSFRRKAIAAFQMMALAMVIAPFVASRMSAAIAALALFTLALSFLLDIAWLLRHAARSHTAVSDQ